MSDPIVLPENECMIGLELTRAVSTYEVEGRPLGWRMQVSASKASNVDPNVFLYRVRGPDPFTVAEYGTFEGIANPEQLEAWPINEPDESGSPRMYRLAEVDLVFSNKVDLETAWAELKSSCDELVRTLITMCTLVVDEIHSIGDFESDSSSEAL